MASGAAFHARIFSRASVIPLGALLAGAAMLGATPAAAGTSDDLRAASRASAIEIVKRMSAYMASQPNLSANFDADLQIITPEVEKIELLASGSVTLSRPNKIRVTRNGGYNDVEMISDGNKISIYNHADNSYSQKVSPSTIDQLVDLLRNQYGIDMPAGDLLLTDAAGELLYNAVEAKHIGVGIIDNVECEHLAFRNLDTDWQLWVRTGPQPLPCKYVISSKTVAASPEYSITFRNWATPQSVPLSTFTFVAPAGSKSVPFEQMTGIGELPSPTPFNDGDRK